MRIRLVLKVGAGVLLVAALGAACAAKKSEPFPDVASFCNAKAQAECQIASTCLIPAKDCEAQRASLCNTDATSAMASGTRNYVQANAQPCIDAVNKAYGNGNTKVSFAQLVGDGSITDTCERVFSGNAGMNEPCESSYDCTGGFICAPVMPGTPAEGGADKFVCAPSVSVAAGQFCSTPGSTCATDTYCAMPPSGGAFDCEPAKQQNAPCDPATAPCVSSQRCETQSGVTGQTCEPRVLLGQSCQTSDDCDPSAPYCDPYVGNKCTPGLSFASGASDCQAFMSTPATPAVTGADAGGD
jgi:hypothetical protein